MTKVIHIGQSGGDNEVYVGRPGKGNPGPFGNPFRKGSFCGFCGTRHEDGASTLPCYKQYLTKRINSDPSFREQIKGLYGKTLVCFCPGKDGLTTADKPFICHGQYLALAAEILSKG